MKIQTAENLASQITQPNFRKEAFLNYCANKDVLINSLVQAKWHEEAFYGKVTKDVTSNIHEAIENPPVELKVGDYVTFVNEFGCAFPNNRVLGFDLKPYDGKSIVYTDSDAYWCAKPYDSIIKQNGLIGIEESDLAVIEEKYNNGGIPWDVKMVRAKKAEAEKESA